MPQLDTNNVPATVPEQSESKPPLRKSMPVVIALVVIVALIGIANLSSLLTGNKKAAPASALTMSPTTPNAQQVSSFETQQRMQLSMTRTNANVSRHSPRPCSSFSRSRMYPARRQTQPRP